MRHPFGEQLGIKFAEPPAGGRSRCTLAVVDEHRNPHGVAHGAVVFAMADTGMGAALYPTLEAGEIWATIAVKIKNLKAGVSGVLACVTENVNRGKAVANLESGN